MASRLKSRAGFTMLDLTMALVMSGTLVATAIPRFSELIDQAQIAANTDMFSKMSRAIDNIILARAIRESVSHDPISTYFNESDNLNIFDEIGGGTDYVLVQPPAIFLMMVDPPPGSFEHGEFTGHWRLIMGSGGVNFVFTPDYDGSSVIHESSTAGEVWAYSTVTYVPGLTASAIKAQGANCTGVPYGRLVRLEKADGEPSCPGYVAVM